MWQAGAIFQGEWENFHVGMYVTAYSYTKNTIVLGWGEFCFVFNWGGINRLYTDRNNLVKLAIQVT